MVKVALFITKREMVENFYRLIGDVFSGGAVRQSSNNYQRKLAQVE